MASGGTSSFAHIHRVALAFIGTAMLVAMAALAADSTAAARLLDLLAASASLALACAAINRLVLGATGVEARRAWMAVFALAMAIVVAEIAPLFVRYSNASSLLAGFAILVAASVVVVQLRRHDRSMRRGRHLALLALALQAASLAVDAVVRWPGPNAGMILLVKALTLAALLAYVMAAAMTTAACRRELFATQSGPADVGDYARYLYATLGLYRKIRHPRIGNLTLPGHKAVFVLLRFVRWFPTIAPKVRRKFGVGLRRQFLDLFVAAIRHGIDAQVYYMFEFYRPAQRARISGYVTRYEMKNGLYKVLTWQIPKARQRIMLGDKFGMYRICLANNIPTVPILLQAERGELVSVTQDLSQFARDLFIKPRQSKGSRGVEVVSHADGIYVAEDGTSFDHQGLLDFARRRSLKEPILVQPLIRNHDRIADLADVALMRIRVITCLDAKGEPVATHAVLSNLSKLETNWKTDIELGAAIDLASGALGMMTGDKADMWLDWSETHPITGAQVLGRIVPCWNEVLSIAVKAHAACRDRFLVGWDIAVGQEGALLLEGNSYPDVDFLQRSYQAPVADSPLGPHLFSRLADIAARSDNGTLLGPKAFIPGGTP